MDSKVYLTNKKAKEKAKRGVDPFARKRSSGCDSGKCCADKSDVVALHANDTVVDSGK